MKTAETHCHPQPCVYKIECLVNGRIYVGSTRQNVIRRYKRHLCSLRHRTIANTNRNLQADFDRYGEDAFFVEVLEWMWGPSKTDLQDRENAYIQALTSEERYNITSQATTAGYKHSQEVCESNRERNRGKMCGVAQVDLKSGLVIAVFDSQREASIKTGIPVGSISNVSASRVSSRGFVNKSAGGFGWRRA